MSNLINSIASLCHQLIEKPTNIQTSYSDDYMNAVENYGAGNEQYMEIVRSKSNCALYVNLKKNINIKLFRELSIDLNFNDMDKQVYTTLHEESQVVKNGNRNHIAMQKGDIEIKFNNTPLSKVISENEFIQKNGAIIKGEDCFIERVSPGGRDGERYALIVATQEDLKEILIGLMELV